jgi:hypothetical protein
MTGGSPITHHTGDIRTEAMRTPAGLIPLHSFFARVGILSLPRPRDPQWTRAAFDARPARRHTPGRPRRR